ncbi:metal-dependent hydrolase [Anaerobacillus alkaliphilus]|uniref:Metal-dependent hydrolase n=1 Tax=Anaerobacillus alkaliphilus TaxID=1548597 RepID=A0A4Q0VTL0_9BACI|nr:metal-dependent hydrolase [Anaerobacillus alkaliphilus]RXJ01930.1 metal-dependent hydrolase [Anaerobacillus alkaliphilus]
MDTITHTLFGLTLYGAINKRNYTKEQKRALLFTTVVGSQIPDIDVVSRLWDTEGQYQMWHRGITHSIFLVPVWALVIALLCYLFWRVKDRRIFLMGVLAVFIHNTSDLFNAWGTGYFEPFSSIRITFGTIPIIDFVIWGIILSGFILSKKSKWPSYRIYQYVWLAIVLHIVFQTSQGYLIYQQTSTNYEQMALSASFAPWNYTVIGKNGNVVEISHRNLWSEPILHVSLTSSEDTNLDDLFAQKPEARTLYEWSPFVVVVDEDDIVGIYDPRFYRNGQSFLFEYIEKEG